MAFKDPEDQKRYQAEWKSNWRQTHLEEAKAYDKAYREAHKEEYNARMRAYRAANPEKFQGYSRTHYDKRKDKLKAYQKEHNQKPEVRVQINKRSRNRRQNERLEVLRILGGKCIVCGFSDERALQVDHVIAEPGNRTRHTSHKWAEIKRDIDLGDHNYQLLCANCHCIKTRENGEYNHPNKKGG